MGSRIRELILAQFWKYSCRGEYGNKVVAGSSGVKKLKNVLFLVRAITTCSYNNKNDPSDSKKLMMWKREKCRQKGTESKTPLVALGLDRSRKICFHFR